MAEENPSQADETPKFPFMKYRCPYCSVVRITHKPTVVECPACHRKYKTKKPEIIQQGEI